MTMEEILGASFGEDGNTIRARFKKTVMIRQYETEVIESDSEVTVPKEITGAERLLLQTLLQAQLEYSVFSNLYIRGLVTPTEFSDRKKQLEEICTVVKNKAERVLGRSVDEFIKSP